LSAEIFVAGQLFANVAMPMLLFALQLIGFWFWCWGHGGKIPSRLAVKISWLT
jgi:hypothetical protein